MWSYLVFLVTLFVRLILLELKQHSLQGKHKCVVSLNSLLILHLVHLHESDGHPLEEDLLSGYELVQLLFIQRDLNPALLLQIVNVAYTY